MQGPSDRAATARARRGRGCGVLAVLVMVAAVVAAGCGTGKDAVTQGDTFQFVSPGGKTVITYAPKDRRKIADLRGPDLVTDRPLALESPEFTGKVVVVNVWGSWCGPCRGESDDLEEVYEHTKAEGVGFLGINFRDDRQSARDFVADRAIAFPSIFDFAGATLSALTTPTSVVPTTVVLDRQHRPAVVYLKAISAPELDAAVRRVLAEPGSRT